MQPFECLREALTFVFSDSHCLVFKFTNYVWPFVCLQSDYMLPHDANQGAGTLQGADSLLALVAATKRAAAKVRFLLCVNRQYLLFRSD